MTDTLLLKTTLLAVKISGTVNIPQNARTNSAAVKAVIEYLKYPDSQILYAGHEDTQPNFEQTISEDTIVARIHVVDAPMIPNFNRPANEIVKWYLKQLRSSKEHIVIINTAPQAEFVQTTIDIYVRGIFIPSNESKVRNLHQPTNRLDYAV